MPNQRISWRPWRQNGGTPLLAEDSQEAQTSGECDEAVQSERHEWRKVGVDVEPKIRAGAISIQSPPLANIYIRSAPV
jgi:hypothetical protein